MTRPFAVIYTHRAGLPEHRRDRAYEHAVKPSPHGFGYCKTPHSIQRETILYRGYCPLCCANGAGMDEEENATE